MRKILLCLALSLPVSTIPLLGAIQPAFAQLEQDRLKQTVAEAYNWREKYEMTIDGFVAEALRSGFWSKNQNKLTETQRAERVRGLLMENEKVIIDRAAGRVVSKYPTLQLMAHLENKRGYKYSREDMKIKALIDKAYYDAIFEAIKTYSNQAHMEFDAR